MASFILQLIWDIVYGHLSSAVVDVLHELLADGLVQAELVIVDCKYQVLDAEGLLHPTFQRVMCFEPYFRHVGSMQEVPGALKFPLSLFAVPQYNAKKKK